MNKAPLPGYVELVETVADYLRSAISEISLPVAPQDGDETLRLKRPDVYKMRLPDSHSAKKVVPYIIVKFVTAIDKKAPTKRTESRAVLRLIFAVFGVDEEEGSMSLLELIDTVRNALLVDTWIDGRFKLDKEAGSEALVYEDDTAPYFAGEMMATFEFASPERSVNYGFNEEKRYSFDAFETET
ncbi:MAG: hypothetical protein IJK23_09950 [Clostridia bacterium]|nr:hypothetical protein [Clostridia bacterium]